MAAHLALARSGIRLRGISVLDYGFGGGSFLRSCRNDCRLAGVEVDSANVSETRDMLLRRGFGQVELATLDVSHWRDHPLISPQRRYDLIVLSHVLEHLDEPVELLTRLKSNLSPHGVMLAIVPLNEITPDPNHKWVCDRALIERWSDEGGLSLRSYEELDHVGYFALPLFQAKGALGRLIAQAASLSLGLVSSFFSATRWFSLDRGLRHLGARPSQGAFVLSPLDSVGPRHRIAPAP